MKRILPLFLVVLLLCGCAPKLADHTDTGDRWNPDWTIIGTEVGVADPGSGLTLYEYNDVQGLDGIYYAAFTYGKPRSITNDSGKEAELFPAQLYLLTQECLELADAEQAIAQWKAVGETGYTLIPAEPTGDFQVYLLEPKGESPFVSGILALGIHNQVAVSVELMCADKIFDNERDALEGFLAGLRFRAQEG